MATKTNKNLSASAQTVLTAVLKTRNLPALCLIVKAVIARRANEEITLNFEKVGDKKSRTRTEGLCLAISALEEKNAIAAVFKAAISQRKVCRRGRDNKAVSNLLQRKV